MEITKLKSSKSFGGETAFYSHKSNITNTTMNFSVFMPENAKPQGCVIWLSGLTCTEENFVAKAGAQQFLAKHNMMVICPDTSPRGLELSQEHESWDFGSGAGFYVNATTQGYRDHYQMFDYIWKEIYTLVTDNFNVAASHISISGHSMGGHGALILGLTHADKFASISAFSPIVNPLECPWGQKAFKGYLGEENKDTWSQYDACELVSSGKSHPKSIMIDQGTADEFLERELLTKNFVQICSEQGQSTNVSMRDGYDHSYYFIASFIDQHLDFHLRAWETGK